jgi:hypothetical protein
MKKLLFSFTIFGSMALASITNAFAGDRDFTLVNRTQYNIIQIFIRTPGNDWAPIGHSYVGSFTSRDFTIYNDGNGCRTMIKLSWPRAAFRRPLMVGSISVKPLS